MHNLANIYDRLSRYREAEPLYVEALEGKRRVQGPKHPETSRTLSSLGAMYAKQQRFPEAETALLDAYAGLSRSVGDHDSRTQFVIDQLVAVYAASGDTAKVREWQGRRALEANAR